MTPFEQQLKEALARQEPSADFTSRVLAAARQQQSPPRVRWLQTWRLLPAIAVLMLLITGAGIFQRQRQRMVRGEEAKEKLLLAMHIAGSSLNDARQRVLEMETGKAQQ